MQFCAETRSTCTIDYVGWVNKLYLPLPRPTTVANRVEAIVTFGRPDLDMRHIQYRCETLPHSPFPLVLAFHLVLGKFHI